MNITNETLLGLPAAGVLITLLGYLLMAVFMAYHSFLPEKYKHENSGKDVFSTAFPLALIWASVSGTVQLSGNLVVATLILVATSGFAYVVLKMHAKKVMREYSD